MRVMIVLLLILLDAIVAVRVLLEWWTMEDK
jgi:hypothetical protein